MCLREGHHVGYLGRVLGRGVLNTTAFTSASSYVLGKECKQQTKVHRLTVRLCARCILVKSIKSIGQTPKQVAIRFTKHGKAIKRG